MHILKKIIKVSFIILIILLISFVVYRYYTLKKDGKLEKVFSNFESSSISNESLSTSTPIFNVDEDLEKEEKKESTHGEEYLVEEKNYDGYYNKFNLDTRILLYEGKNHPNAVKEVIDILIQDADDPLYLKPSVIFQNFHDLSTNEITENNLDEYKNVLKTARNSIGGSTCTISFEYNKLKTVINKVIITKN